MVSIHEAGPGEEEQVTEEMAAACWVRLSGGRAYRPFHEYHEAGRAPT